MNNWIKRIGISLTLLIFLVIVIIHVADHIMSYSDKEIYEIFADLNRPVDVVNSKIGNSDIRIIAEKQNLKDSILIVFVHGAPGSWDAFKDYLIDNKLTDNARLISYDRAGYGNSSSAPMPSIIDQAEILSYIIDAYRLPKVMVIGHSYGCPIAGYASTLIPNQIDKAILIAPLIDPISEPIFWYSYFSYWKPTKWLLPSGFRTAGVEKFTHSKHLKEIQKSWNSMETPITIIHGMKDGLAPPKENIKFAEENIPSHLLDIRTYPDNGHLILWSDYDLVRNIVLEEIETL